MPERQGCSPSRTSLRLGGFARDPHLESDTMLRAPGCPGFRDYEAAFEAMPDDRKRRSLRVVA